jgi:hypothetical protein
MMMLMDECIDGNSTYRDVIFVQYNEHTGGLIENWYVDEYGEPTDLYQEVEVPGMGPAPAIERWRCLVCGQRFYDWQEVLDHFPEPEEDTRLLQFWLGVAPL